MHKLRRTKRCRRRAFAFPLPVFCRPLNPTYMVRSYNSHTCPSVSDNKDGVVDKYKARRVCRGDTATPGVQFDQIFAPTTSYDSVRILTSIAAAEGLDLYQLDISQAFLQAPIEKDLWSYKSYEPGDAPASKGSPRLVAKLNKSLYGLPSSPRQWYLTLSTYLQELGFSQATGDAGRQAGRGELDPRPSDQSPETTLSQRT